MSHSTELLITLTGRVTQLLDNTIHLEEDSIADDQSPSVPGSSISEAQETVSLQDLINSPEFIEEQRMMMLEFEASQLRIEDERKKTLPRMRDVQQDYRPRRSSIGIKLSCPVCLESFGSARSSYVKMVTECGHVFCQECIENVCTAATVKDRRGHVKQEETLCPVCRKRVGELRKVYF